MFIEDDKFIFYEEQRDRFRCVINRKYVASSKDLATVIEKRNKYIADNQIDLTMTGITQRKNGCWIYRKTLGGVRYEVFVSTDLEKVIKAKQVFNERIQSEEISVSKIEKHTRKRNEQDRRTVRYIAQDDETIWGHPGLFV